MPASVLVYRYTVFYAGNVYRYTEPATDDSRGEGFGRDAPTRLSYAVVAGYAFWLYAFGPELALLRAELHFSYAVLGTYSAVWAGGAALAGMTFAPLARRLPRAALIVAGLDRARYRALVVLPERGALAGDLRTLGAEVLVPTLKTVKKSRQIIFATHNPNILVLSETDRVFVLEGTRSSGRLTEFGTVDEVRGSIERLVEGGREAFLLRSARYGHGTAP